LAGTLYTGPVNHDAGAPTQAPKFAQGPFLTSRTHSLGVADAFPSRLFVALSLIVALGPCTVDLYIAAFLAFRGDLGVSESTVQLTLTATTLGLALGQLVAGPWSEVVGRRVPILVATVTHIVGSVGVAAAPALM
jgi:MFS family permease